MHSTLKKLSRPRLDARVGLQQNTVHLFITMELAVVAAELNQESTRGYLC